MKNKRGKGGCETALLPASFSMHCLWFVGDMKTAYAASRCQQNYNLCMLAFGRMAEKPFFQTVYAVSLMVWDVVV